MGLLIIILVSFDGCEVGIMYGLVEWVFGEVKLLI